MKLSIEITDKQDSERQNPEMQEQIKFEHTSVDELMMFLNSKTDK